MDEVKIEKLDNFGRGICYVNDKITFVNKTLPGEIVKIKVIKESKKYNEAIVREYISLSKDRVDSLCPYYALCGGCSLLHTSYNESLKFKKEKLEGILKKYCKIDRDIDVVASVKELGYRNKITLKVEKGKYGYYEEATHKIVEINDCFLAEEPIREFLCDVRYLKIVNGELVIRCNYNGELLIWIRTKEDIEPNINYLREHHKIAGIVVNDKVIHGDYKFVEVVNKQLFNVSYDSFFQVNRGICAILFNLINQYIEDNEVIMDLYCGVGTLGINAALKADKIFGIEIVRNAVLNAIKNAQINKRANAYYLLGDVKKCLSKIKVKVDTIIVDPPRSGLDKVTKETIINFKPHKIIYVSCDPMTLSRDLNDLKNYYDIVDIKGLDMFPYTYHVECVCVLNLR